MNGAALAQVRIIAVFCLDPTTICYQLPTAKLAMLAGVYLKQSLFEGSYKGLRARV
jgi:hypothetical protein